MPKLPSKVLYPVLSTTTLNFLGMMLSSVGMLTLAAWGAWGTKRWEEGKGRGACFGRRRKLLPISTHVLDMEYLP